MADHTLFDSLLSSTTTSTTVDDNETEYNHCTNLISSNSSILLRLLLIIFIGLISIWADYEASKGFGITIINDTKDSPAGKRLTLLYISNGKAIRMLLNSSTFVESILYYDNDNDPTTNHMNMKKKKKIKQVNHVTLRLAINNNDNLSNSMVGVLKTNIANNEFVIKISASPSMIMEAGSNDRNQLDCAVTSMVLQGMARIWLWNSKSNAMNSSWVLDGIVEYINGLAGFGPMRNNFGGYDQLPEFGHFCPGDKYKEYPMVVARFLDYGERRNKGFIQQINQGLKGGWDDRTVEDTVLNSLCDSPGFGSGILS